MKTSQQLIFRDVTFWMSTERKDLGKRVIQAPDETRGIFFPRHVWIDFFLDPVSSHLFTNLEIVELRHSAEYVCIVSAAVTLSVH